MAIKSLSVSPIDDVVTETAGQRFRFAGARRVHSRGRINDDCCSVRATFVSGAIAVEEMDRGGRGRSRKCLLAPVKPLPDRGKRGVRVLSCKISLNWALTSLSLSTVLSCCFCVLLFCFSYNPIARRVLLLRIVLYTSRKECSDPMHFFPTIIHAQSN